MGREIKRVALDFDWPLNKRWAGFCYAVETRTTENCGCADPWTKEGMCAWHRTEWALRKSIEVPPPEGEGWQVWETVTEGSPISPVFPTREALIDWLCSPAYAWGISHPLTREQAENFVSNAWAPSMVYTNATGLVSGDAFMGGAS
jgi:hypothetical protein